MPRLSPPPDLHLTAHPAHPSNWAAGRAGFAPVAVVFHVMQGTLAGTRAWFATARPAPTSAHFGVGADGTCDQYVSPDDTAYSNGYLRQPQRPLIPWITEWQRQDRNPNWATISIEMEGQQHGTWVQQVGGIETFAPGSITTPWVPTEPQYQTVLRLTRWLVGAYCLPVDRAHLCRHSDFDHVAKWWCPGAGFPLGRLLRDLGGS